MVRRAGTRKGREKSGYFAIEGLRLHERAVRAGVTVPHAIMTAGFMKEPSPRVQKLIANLQQQGCQMAVVPDREIKAIVGERDLGQILGVVRMPRPRRLAEVVGANNDIYPLLLAAIDVKDPGNVGALLRTAHAAGATGFLATGISDPYHPRALRTTMGSLFKIPVLYYEQPFSLISELHQLGIEALGSTVVEGIPLPQTNFAESGVAVFVGSEAWGLPEEVLQAVDGLVSIPMAAGVDSFSVNAAAAIILYEIGRQWGRYHG
jgi:TrmH family RNA methyltransferase